MSVFVIKCIAAIFMVVDHIKYAFPALNNNFTLYFGRISFPLFAFGIVQGYKHTKDLKRYVKRLILLGLFSQIPFSLFTSLPTLDVVSLNINFTFVLGILAIIAYDKSKNKLKGLVYALLIGLLGNITLVDYGFYGVILIFSLYIFNESKLKTLLTSGLVITLKYLYRILKYNNGIFSEYYIMNWICSMLPLFILLLYNGKRGKNFKWFFYVFYPLHLLILYVISPLTF